MAMNNRSQSVSTQLIVSLVTVVAVNSAFWWHRSREPRLGNEESAQKDQKASLREKKRVTDGRKTKKTTSNVSSSCTKGRTLVHPSLMKKDSIKSQKNNVASREKGLKSKRPKIQQVNLTSIQTRSRRTKTKKAQPRVRESLLPWNTSRQDRSVVDARELQEESHDTLLHRIQVSAAAGSKGIAQRQNDRTEERKPTRVRDSLLPWSARDENMDSPLDTEKRSARIPRVRNSLLPESIRSNNKTAADCDDGDSIGVSTNRSGSQTREHEEEHRRKSPKPSAHAITPEDCVTIRSCDRVLEYPVIRGSIRREDRQPLLTRVNDSNVTARSSTTSLSAKPGNKALSPLRNLSNTKRSRVPSKRRKSSELKEEGWRTSLVSKPPRETMKSPTLLRLSSRKSDISDCDVKSLCKVFEH